MFAASGGCGKTTFATNLAVVLAQSGHRVCLVDLDLDYGGVAAALQLTPEGVSFGALVTGYRPGLDCVLAPVVPGDTETVTPGLVSELLTFVSAEYEHVIVDTPARFSGLALTALDHAHHHVLITVPERPALHNLRGTLDMFDLLSYRRTTRSVVLNRVEPAIGLSPHEVDLLLRTPVAVELPSTLDVPLSINRGVPLAVTEPDHPFVRAVRRFSRDHVAGDRAPPRKP